MLRVPCLGFAHAHMTLFAAGLASCANYHLLLLILVTCALLMQVTQGLCSVVVMLLFR